MKIAVTGKGGVGKTTISSLLCRLFIKEGFKVIAVDADPDANLALALGFTLEQADQITPIAELTELIQERTGTSGDTSGLIFKINPQVDDMVDKYGAAGENLRLLTLGKIKPGKSGCFCPEGVFLKRLLHHVITKREELVIIDMEAGIEHLTRGTTSYVDALIIVIEPGQKSFQTARTIKKLAHQLGLNKIFLVLNKVQRGHQIELSHENFPEDSFLGEISFDQRMITADLTGKTIDLTDSLAAEMEIIKNNLRAVIQAESEEKA